MGRYTVALNGRRWMPNAWRSSLQEKWRGAALAGLRWEEEVRAHQRALQEKLNAGGLLDDGRGALRALVDVQPLRTWAIWDADGNLREDKAVQLGFKAAQLPRTRRRAGVKGLEDIVVGAILRHVADHTQGRLSEEYALMRLQALSDPPLLTPVGTPPPGELVSMMVDLVNLATKPVLRAVHTSTPTNGVKQVLLEGLSKRARTRTEALKLRSQALRWQRELVRLSAGGQPSSVRGQSTASEQPDDQLPGNTRHADGERGSVDLEVLQNASDPRWLLRDSYESTQAWCLAG